MGKKEKVERSYVEETLFIELFRDKEVASRGVCYIQAMPASTRTLWFSCRVVSTPTKALQKSELTDCLYDRQFRNDDMDLEPLPQPDRLPSRSIMGSALQKVKQ